VEGCYDTQWLSGLWCTQAKLQGIMLKTALHWGTGSSVVKDSLGEPGRTPLYIILLSVWSSWTVTVDVFLHFVGGFLYEE
jgi:hypothetical protein